MSVEERYQRLLERRKEQAFSTVQHPVDAAPSARVTAQPLTGSRLLLEASVIVRSHSSTHLVLPTSSHIFISIASIRVKYLLHIRQHLDLFSHLYIISMAR